MKYSELIAELEYWRSASYEEDPEIVISDDSHSYEIIAVEPAKGVKYYSAIGLIF